MRRLLVFASVGVLALSACDRREAARRPDATPSKPAEAAFRHWLSADVSGDYRPIAGAEAEGDGRVAGLFVGQEAAFRAWEAGDRASAPLILTLAGPDGPVQVLPTTYEVSGDVLRFTGALPSGGEVAVRGRIDQGALATARRNLGDTTPVVTGVLAADGRSVPFSLGRWGGD